MGCCVIDKMEAQQAQKDVDKAAASRSTEEKGKSPCLDAVLPVSLRSREGVPSRQTCVVNDRLDRGSLSIVI